MKRNVPHILRLVLDEAVIQALWAWTHGFLASLRTCNGLHQLHAMFVGDYAGRAMDSKQGPVESGAED